MTAAARLRRHLAEALTTHMTSGSRRPVIPEAGRLHWSFFVDLHAQRAIGEAGPQPLTFAEIEAWARLTRWPLRPHDVAAILALDAAYLANRRKVATRLAGGMKTVQSAPEHEITAAAFDAVFG